MDIEIENGRALINQVSVRAYPARVDTSLQTLFQLDSDIPIPALSSIEIKGNWADPNGGGAINATNIQTMVTGTGYTFFDGIATPMWENIVITPSIGAEGFVYKVYNNGAAGILNSFNIRGFGIYPYNPVEA